MKKVKQFALLFILSFGLFSCETESIDGKITEEGVLGEPILRFNLNGETRIATGDDITVAIGNDQLIHVTAVIRDRYNDFQPMTFQISFTNRFGLGSSVDSDIVLAAETGTYVTALNQVSLTEPKWSRAMLHLSGSEWSYSTENINIIDEGNRDRGSMTIDAIRTQSNQMEGTFHYEMYLPSELGSVDNTINIDNGYFKYLKL